VIRRLRATALTAKGFRPFFLLAAAFAASILPVWMLAYAGMVDLNGYLDAIYWHAHEILFGYATAASSGRKTPAPAVFLAHWTARTRADALRACATDAGEFYARKLPYHRLIVAQRPDRPYRRSASSVSVPFDPHDSGAGWKGPRMPTSALTW